MSTLSELMVELNAITEGKTEHIDTVGLKTSAYGLVIDPSKPKAYEANKKAASSLGYDIDNLTPEQAKEVALETYRNIQLSLKKDLKDTWDSLGDEHKLVLMDAKYNTGATFKNYAKNALAYQVDKTEENLKNLINESTRVQSSKNSEGKTVKERTKGLDNRVARVLNAVGIVSDINKARELGLDKADDNVVSSDIKESFAERLNPTVNIGAEGDTGLESAQKEAEVPSLLDQTLYSEEPESLLDKAMLDIAQKEEEPSPEEEDFTKYRVQSGDSLSKIYNDLDIKDNFGLSKADFYERMYFENPEAFGKSGKASTLKSNAILNLGGILEVPEVEEVTLDLPEAPAIASEEYVDLSSEFDQVDEDFDPRLDIF